MSSNHKNLPILEGIEGPRVQVDDILQHLTVLKGMFHHVEHSRSRIDVISYFPQNKAESDIQMFNLSEGKTIPSHLESNEDIAMWLLETDVIDRKMVANFLTDATIQNTDKILDSIASKITSLDAAQGLIEGLRLYLPVVGGIHRLTDDISSSIPFLADHTKLTKLLSAYAKAHLQNCKKPIVSPLWSNSSFEKESRKPLTVVVALLFEILELYSVLAVADRPLSAIMIEFYNAIKFTLSQFENEERVIHQRHIGNSPQQQTAQIISSKSLTDLFNTITAGSALVALPSPSDKTPSYLFADVILSSSLKIRFDIDDSFESHWGALCHNALYLLSSTTSGDSLSSSATKFVSACIPLEYVDPRLTDNISRHVLIDLYPALDATIPFVIMAHDPKSKVSTGPAQINYYSKITIEIIPEPSKAEEATHGDVQDSIEVKDPSHAKSDFKKKVDSTMMWLDRLEIASWESCNKYELA